VESLLGKEKMKGIEEILLNKAKGFAGRGESRHLRPLVVTFTDTGAFALRPKKNITQN